MSHTLPQAQPSLISVPKQPGEMRLRLSLQLHPLLPQRFVAQRRNAPGPSRRQGSTGQWREKAT